MSRPAAERGGAVSAEALKAAIKEVEARPCECVLCGECRGTGNILVDTFGYPEEGLEPCDSCNGGISETCDRCHELEELLEELEYAAERKP